MAAGFSPEIEEFLSCEADFNLNGKSVERCSESSSSEEESSGVQRHMDLAQAVCECCRSNG